jgi:nitroreductase
MARDNMPSHHGIEETSDSQYPNTTLKLLMERASLRNFSSRKISRRVLQYILEAGTHAATGGNLQPYSIIKIESGRTRKRLAKMCWQPFMAKAPVHLLFCIDWHRLQRWAKIEIAPFSATSSFRHFWIAFQDTVICAQNMCTAADSLGLGSVYIGTIMEFFPEMKRMCKLPNGVVPVVLLCIGYPKTKPRVRRKLGVESVVHDETYREIDDAEIRNAYNDKYPNLKVEVTKSRLERIRRVCTKIHGKKFADACIAAIKKNKYINPAQRYFGMHYDADMMPEGNERFIKIMKKFGFTWFEKFKPRTRRKRS